MPKKGQIVINPNTQRPVKVGSRTWLKLVKEGIFEGVYDDPNELYTYEENEDVEEKRRELNKTLPRNKQAVKGRGKYKNKLVIRNKRLNPKDVADYTRKNTIKAVADNFGELENLTDEEIEAKLEELIMKQMMLEKPKGSKRNSGAKNKQKEVWRQIEVSDDEDEDEDSAEVSDTDEGSDIEW